MGSKLAAEPGQIESSVDLPHHVIFGNCIAKTKLVEQLTLVTLQTAHHGSTAENRVDTTESRFEGYLNRLLQQNLPQADIGT
jgi:hypothetical protein